MSNECFSSDKQHYEAYPTEEKEQEKGETQIAKLGALEQTAVLCEYGPRKKTSEGKN